VSSSYDLLFETPDRTGAGTLRDSLQVFAKEASMETKMRRAVEGLLVLLLCAGRAPAFGAGPAAVSLVSPTTETTLSGALGTPFTVGDAGSSTHAVFGLSNWEQSDEPCKVSVSTESLMNSAQDSTGSKSLCGGHTPGDLIKVSFEDAGPGGSRAFVTGVRVCMNNQKDKVKGIAIRGMKITDAGELAELDPVTVTSKAGGSEVRTLQPNVPTSIRPNCDEKDGWKQWADCPAGSLATAAVLHYGAGKEPRSLTGIALKCRALKKGTPAAQ
jgi:hypothetical protein